MKKVLFILVLLFAAPLVSADNTGEQSPASSANEASPTTAWVGLASLFLSDDAWSVYTGTAKDSLYVTNFTMGVTAGHTIDSIFVSTEGQGTASNQNRRRIKITLVKDGKTPVGESVDHTHNQTDANDNIVRSTGSTTPLWNTTWTAAEVNATGFGVVLWKTATQAGEISIDHVTIYVAFTVGGGDPDVSSRRIRIINTGG